MPIVVAIAIRYIIMAAVQLGIWTAIEKYGLPLLNKAVIELMQAFGMTEEEAKAVMANKIIVAMEEVGIFAATLKTKMPIKVAQYLGFTSKGFVLRKVSSAGALAAEKTAISATTKAVATTAEVAKVAEVAAKSSGWAIKGVGDLLKYVTLFIGTPVGFFYALAQYVDYGAWQNPYQKTFQGLLGYIGIEPDKSLASAKTISADVWKRIYSTIEQLKPLGISFPYSDKDTPYSRENLAAVVDEIAANMVKVGTQPTYKNVMASLLLTLQFGGKEPNVPNFPYTGIPLKNVSSSSTGGGTTTSNVKVFTGIVSQGVVGQGLVFTPRPDDLIESVAELREAAANNLAPFLASLPGKVVYEVKVVSSIVTKDGFRQTGTVQQVQTGTFADGKPKYKTVVNKFATLVLFILTEKNTRTKLGTIVLGPVDSTKLQVGQNDLRSLETQLPSLVTTQNVNDIKGIETANPITITTPPPAPPEVQPVNVEETVDTGWRFYSFSVNGEEYINVQPWLGNIPFGHTQLTQAEYLKKKAAQLAANPARWQAYFESMANDEKKALTGGKSGFVIVDNVPYAAENSPLAGTNHLVNNTGGMTNKSGASATTLFDWYQAQGQSLPSVSDRSATYERLGLGPRSYYTGTAEQNTKLLNALKSA